MALLILPHHKMNSPRLKYDQVEEGCVYVARYRSDMPNRVFMIKVLEKNEMGLFIRTMLAGSCDISHEFWWKEMIQSMVFVKL